MKQQIDSIIENKDQAHTQTHTHTKFIPGIKFFITIITLAITDNFMVQLQL